MPARTQSLRTPAPRRGAAWRRCWPASARPAGRAWRPRRRPPGARCRARRRHRRSASSARSRRPAAARSAAPRRARKAAGVKPSRFMPLFIFRKTRCGWCVLCAASQSICSSQCTTCHRFRREHSSRSRGSKQPSSSRIGPRQPSARTRSASARSSSAKPSAPRSAGEGALDAVAVGVGLDHRPDARVGRGGARARQVVRQRVGVDQGFDRARHVRRHSASGRAGDSDQPARTGRVL